MFNLPLRLREPKGTIVPQGPNFNWARRVICDIDGSEIRFKAPKHQEFRGAREPAYPERFIDTKKTRFRDYYEERHADYGLIDHWREHTFFCHSWGFNGPWFTGRSGILITSFNLIKLINYPGDMSLFHPHAFEKVVGDYLEHMYAWHYSDIIGIHTFIAPTEWRPLHHLPVNAVHLKVIPHEDFRNFETIHHVYFPFENQLLACLMFWPRALKTGHKFAQVDEKPMLALMDNIIDSIQLTLSPKAVAQQAAALAGVQDRSLVTHYPPIQWPKPGEGKRKAAMEAITSERKSSRN